MNELPVMTAGGAVQGTLNVQQTDQAIGARQFAAQVGALVSPLEELVMAANAMLEHPRAHATEEEEAQFQQFFTELGHDIELWHGITSTLAQAVGELARGQ